MVDVICPPLSISSIVVSLWLASCLGKSTLSGWREYYGGGGVGVDRHLCGAQQTWWFDPMLFHYWPTANGAGPTLKQHWVNLGVCWESCPHYDTRVPSVSGWNRLHSALCRGWGEQLKTEKMEVNKLEKRCSIVGLTYEFDKGICRRAKTNAVAPDLKK